MHFANTAGDRVTLRPVGYEFPGRPADRWDDFLVVRGTVQLADGRTWTFNDPLITALEATRVAPWLRIARQVAETRVPPPPTKDWPEAAMLTFVEPVVALSIAAHQTAESLLRVHLSLEALPPWQPPTEVHGYFLVFPLSPEELDAAAAHWETDIRAFPIRPSTNPY